MRIKLTLLILLIIIVTNKKLIFIQQLFRHGARNPIYQQKMDFSNVSQKWNSYGELTNEGKNMHYLLGKAMYNRYWMQLFGNTPFEKNYNQSIIYVRSTNVNRTIQSAQAHLAGLLENLTPIKLPSQAYEFSLPPWPQKLLQKPQKEWQVFNGNLKSYHPIPIHIVSGETNLLNRGDFLLNYQKTNCPHQQIWTAQNIQSDKAIKIMQLPSVRDALKTLQVVLKKPIPFQKAYKYIDNYISLKYMGAKYLKIYEYPKYKETFEFIKIISMYLTLYYTPIQKKISSTNFFEATFFNFQNAKNNSGPRLVIYSAHDTTIAAVTSSLQMVSVDCIYNHYVNKQNNTDTCLIKYPPYATNLVFELWEDNGQYIIKIMYNGVARKLPFCDMRTECEYERFEKWYQNFRVQDVNKQCGIYDSQSSLYVIIIILALIITLLVVYLIYKKKDMIKRTFKKTDKQYNTNFQEKQVET